MNAIRTLHEAERIVVFGIGPSAHLAHYASQLLTRSGRRTRCLDTAGLPLADQLLTLSRGDALLVMAYGKAYPEVRAAFAEARRLRLPIILISDSLERELAHQADVVVPAKRGRADRVALHGATFVALEAIILGLAASDSLNSLQALSRLNELRATIREAGSTVQSEGQQ